MEKQVNSILIVEDVEMSQIVLRKLLARLLPGVEIDVAEDAPKALIVFQEKMHDLVFVDIQLPKISGYELLETMRAMVGDSHFIVAYSALDSLRSDYKVAFSDVLTKPVTKKKLTDVLERLL